MTHFRSLFFVALTALVGCSAQAAGSSDSASADTAEAPAAPALADQAVVKGDLPVGATTTVSYSPTDYTAVTVGSVPYLAWSVDTQAGPVSVDVSGDFPGSPDVLVTDKDFNVLGQAAGHKLADGTAATSLSVNVPAGPKMLLVRDKIWVKQMQFDISVAQ